MSFLNLERLYPASFRGVSFLYVSGTTTTGRKTAVHEFPQKDFRFVEDLGRNLRVFSITGEIAGAFYQTKKKQLEDALNTAGIGDFIHPVYGKVSVVCTGYELTDNITQEAGVARYEMTFMESIPNVYPNSTGRTKSIINSLYDSLYNLVENDLGGLFIATFVKNIEDAAQRVTGLVDAFNGVVATLSSFDSDEKNTFTADASSAQDNSYRLASNSTDLASTVSSLFSTFDNMSTTPSDRFSSNKSMFGFGFDETLVESNTAEYVQRNDNRKILNGSVNVLAITDMYNSAISIDFEDDISLNNAKDTLSNAYDNLLSSTDVFITDETLDELQNLRNNVESFFEQASLTVNKVIDISTKEISAGALTYQYYGTMSNYNEIISLNSINNPLEISGELRILTS